MNWPFKKSSKPKELPLEERIQNSEHECSIRKRKYDDAVKNAKRVLQRFDDDLERGELTKGQIALRKEEADLATRDLTRLRDSVRIGFKNLAALKQMAGIESQTTELEPVASAEEIYERQRNLIDKSQDYLLSQQAQDSLEEVSQDVTEQILGSEKNESREPGIMNEELDSSPAEENPNETKSLRRKIENS